MSNEGSEQRVCGNCSESKPLSEFSGQSAKCKSCEREWAEWRAGIDERLNEARPARAGSGEQGWRASVFSWARNHMPNETMLVRIIAEREVNARERVATRKGNEVLRGWFTDAQMSLTWADIGFYPILVGNDHVRLDVVGPQDLRQFAREQRRSAKIVYDAVVNLADAAEYLAEMAVQAGVTTVAQLGNLPPHAQEDAA